MHWSGLVTADPPTMPIARDELLALLDVMTEHRRVTRRMKALSRPWQRWRVIAVSFLVTLSLGLAVTALVT